jgi:hypothetical protein
MEAQIGACPKRDAHNIAEKCSVYCSGLVRLEQAEPVRLSDAPASPYRTCAVECSRLPNGNFRRTLVTKLPN